MTSSPPSELGRAGQLVAGKYRLDARIGRGGMGSVWSATHLGLGHRLALKLIAREFVRSPEALRRFDAEARTAARLQSRHVVQVFDNGKLDDGTPYIAMELLDGENLADRIERVRALGLADTVEILAQCCKALGRAHAAGIVHRDIKPENIFLTRVPDEDAEVAKILDFGVAKMALGLDGGSQGTGTGALLGTPLYMSPEQIRGARDVDHRADLYSLGLVAYTMLSGQMAISGETFGDVLIAICTQPLPSLCAVAPWLPYAMEAWFQRTCAREADRRWQSAQELIETLRTAASAGPARSTAPPGSPSSPAQPSTAARIESVTPNFGESAAIAATLAAVAARTPARISAATPPSAVATASHGVPRAPFGPVALSQSAAAVSVTAAGIPRRPKGAIVAAAALAGLFALGGAVLLAAWPHAHDSAASIALPAAGPSGAASSSIAAAAPVLAAAALPSIAVDASVSAPAKPAGARDLPPPSHASRSPDTVLPAYPPALGSARTPPPRPALPEAPINPGY